MSLTRSCGMSIIEISLRQNATIFIQALEPARFDRYRSKSFWLTGPKQSVLRLLIGPMLNACKS